MSLEKILERIERDAQGEINRIRSRTSATVDEIIQKARTEAEARKARILENARNEAEQRKQRIVSAAKLDLRKELLTEKQKDIDAAFREAIEILLKMEDAECRRITKNMILSNVQTGDEEIIFSDRDKARLGNGLVEEINRLLIESGKRGNLTISQDTYNMLGGFVLRRGKIELNSSFESLLKTYRNDLESEVSKLLFPGS